MSNAKTTLAGLLAGLPIAIQAILDAYNAGQFSGKNAGQVAIGVGVILLGLFAKDFNNQSK